MKQFTTHLRTWLAFMLLVLGTSAAGAFDLTINESTNGEGDGRLPIYGIYAGAYQKCEFIVPSTLLASIHGAAINKMTFYIQDNSQRTYIGNCTVFLKEVDATTYSSKKYIGMKDATIVYEGEIDATQKTMEIEFNKVPNYEYKGGNLLIGMYVTELSGTGGTVSFYGVRTENYYAGLASYSWDNYAAVDDVNQMQIINFLPTVTFSCLATPHNIIADCEHGTMTFTGCQPDNTAPVNTPITVTIVPDEGYVAGPVTTNPAVEVNTNPDGTWSFSMPDNSITVISKCLRDIAVKVDVTDPLPLAENDPLRFGTTDPVSFVLEDVLGSPAIPLTKDTHYSVSFDKELNGVGKYKATFTGIPEGGYTNSFDVDFNIQQKHTYTLPANYFGTYFFANAIETFDDIDLATVTAVAADGTATLTKLAESKVAKNYPFLVYNPYDDAKEFDLWETIDDVTPANPTPAAQFTGTADAKAFTAAETAEKDYYVLQNGKEFVYVIGAGTKPAHRCWIELPKAASARILTIAIDQATGISEVKAAANGEGCYDLQGRRMTTMPTQRGLYVIDGKKVVVK